MQIPQNVINMLSAKGKGYVEAAMKIAEGQRMVDEGTLEMAALDGKNLSAKKHMNAGGANVMAAVRDLARPKLTPEYLKTFLKGKDLTTTEIAKAAGCSGKYALNVLKATSGVRTVGAGNQVRWTLGNATSRINQKPAATHKTVANKVTRRKSRSDKTNRQAMADAADPVQQKADEDKIVALLAASPGLSIGGLMEKLKRSYYPVQRALHRLVASGRLKPSTVKTSHRTLQTWVPAPHVA